MKRNGKSGWKALPLIEVATLQRGFDLPVQNRMAGDFPVFAANGPIGTHSEGKVPGPGVVTGRSGTIGKVHYVPTAYWPLNTSLFVKDFHGNHPKFIYYLLCTMKLEHFHEGSGVPTLNRNNIHGIAVLLPPLSEQRRIANILDKADGIRGKQCEADRIADCLLSSGFKAICGIPGRSLEKWPIVDLGDLLSFVTSGSRGWAQHYATTGKRFLRSFDVQMNRIETTDPAYVQAPSTTEATRTSVQFGDVLLTITGSKVGRVAPVSNGFEEAYVSQHVAILRPNDRVLPEYRSMYLSLPDGGQRIIAATRTAANAPATPASPTPSRGR